MISRPAVKGPLSPEALEIRAFFEDRVAQWDDAKPGATLKWDTEVVATAAALALNDALSTGKLHPATRKAFDRA